MAVEAGKAQRQQSPLTPIQGETEEQFIVRGHNELAGSMPDPESRNAAVWAAWDATYGNPERERASVKFRPDQFRTIHGMPLFQEHEKVGRGADGKEVVTHYNVAELSKIIHENNFRIADTDSYVGLVDRHTMPGGGRDPAPPKTLGYVGPFRLGMVGRIHPRFAIFGDEHHRLDKSAELQDRQRRSVEVLRLTANNRRYIDPIAALAEAPRLPLPVTTYTATSGEKVECYSATAPIDVVSDDWQGHYNAVAAGGMGGASPSFAGSANTFAPGGTAKRERHNAAGQESMGPTDTDSIVRQVVDALTTTPEWQTLTAMTQQQQAADGGDPLGGAPGAAPEAQATMEDPGAEPAAMGAPEQPMADPAAMEQPPMAQDPMAMPMEEEGPPPEFGDEDFAEEEGGEFPGEDAPVNGPNAGDDALAQPEGETVGEDDPDQNYAQLLAAGARLAAGAARAGGAAAARNPQAVAEVAGALRKPRPAAPPTAQGGGGGGGGQMPNAGQAEDTATGILVGSGPANRKANSQYSGYQRASRFSANDNPGEIQMSHEVETDQYAAVIEQNAALTGRIEELVADNARLESHNHSILTEQAEHYAALQGEVATLTQERVDAQRTQRIQEMAQRFPCVDVRKEVERNTYGAAGDQAPTDPQFDDRMAIIEEYAAQASVASPMVPAGAEAYSRPQTDSVESARYAAQEAETALAIIDDNVRQGGDTMTYEAARALAKERLAQ